MPGSTLRAEDLHSHRKIDILSTIDRQLIHLETSCWRRSLLRNVAKQSRRNHMGWWRNSHHQRWVRGTQLITFNDWVTIKGKRYINCNNVQNWFPGISGSPLLNITGHQGILSLPYRHRLNERNLDTTQKVKDEMGKINLTLLLVLFGAACGTVICIGFTYRRIIRTKTTGQRVIGSAEGGLNLRGSTPAQTLTQLWTGCRCIADNARGAS